MKILITGGAGFIANTLIGYYVNNNKIIVYDNFHRDTLSNSPYANHPNITIIKGDVLDSNHLTVSMKNADVVLIDGTVWTDDEMSKHGINNKKASEMGHLDQLRG